MWRFAVGAAAVCTVGFALLRRSERPATAKISGSTARRRKSRKTGPAGAAGKRRRRRRRRRRSGYLEHDAAAWLERCAKVRGYSGASGEEGGQEEEGEDDDGDDDAPPTLIFVAGDKSQVGKSSTCLGLVGALHERLGVRARHLAYIKPATQCEGVQLISEYCAARGIACEGIGPVVFFSGFTRSFLAGEQGTSEELLRRIQDAVRALGRGKKVVIVDGVGYPAVGSICGISNAAVAKALGCPVLIVGKKGVGDAVDSFNLNASFFEARGVPVLGGLFNRLPADGYYSLEKCKQAVTSYFEQYRPTQIPFGFVPEVPALAAAAAAVAEKEKEEVNTADDENSNDNNNNNSVATMEGKAGALIDVFWEHVDVRRLLRVAEEKCLDIRNAGGVVVVAAEATTKATATAQAPIVIARSPQVTAAALSSAAAFGNSRRSRPKPKSRAEVFQAEQQKGAQATK